MSVLYSTDRPEFLERVASLAGRTSYRVPEGARGTKQDQLPDAHAIAAALAFAREGASDIGPDVAYCWVLQSDAYRAKVTRLLSDTLCKGSSLSRDHAAAAIGVAWRTMIYGDPGKYSRPSNIDGKAWDALLLLVGGTLYNAAWDSLATAEKCYHRSEFRERA